MSAAKGKTVRGYRSVGDVSFDLDGTFSTWVGWTLFETSELHRAHVRGVIGTFDNYATLVLLRLARDQRPCRVHGRFDDGQRGVREWTLDNVVFTDAEVLDESGFVAFRASAFDHSA